jgi:hypothetical protein
VLDKTLPLDIFGKLVTERLRARAIEKVEALSCGRLKAPSLQALQAELASMGSNEREVVRRCLVSAVDGAIHDFLYSLQEGEYDGASVQVLVGGSNVNELSDGLHGEPYGDDGWITRFSKFGIPPEVA